MLIFNDPLTYETPSILYGVLRGGLGNQSVLFRVSFSIIRYGS